MNHVWASSVQQIVAQLFRHWGIFSINAMISAGVPKPSGMMAMAPVTR